jgi:hypothetical protein
VGASAPPSRPRQQRRSVGRNVGLVCCFCSCLVSVGGIRRAMGLSSCELRRDRRRRCRGLRSTGAWRSLVCLGALIAATFVLASAVAPEAVVVVGFVVTVGSRVPQIIAVRTAERAAGVSWRSGMISVAGNSGWAVWAALEGVWSFFATTIAALTMSAVVALSTYTRQRSDRLGASRPAALVAPLATTRSHRSNTIGDRRRL